MSFPKLLALFLLSFRQSTAQSAEPSSLPRNAVNIADLNATALKQFSFPQSKNTNLFLASMPDPCKKQWANLAGKPMEALADNFKNGKIRLNLECQRLEEEMFRSPYISTMYDLACRSPKDLGRALTKEEESKCGYSLWVYRALIVDRLTFGAAVNNQPPIILFNKLVAAMFSNYIPRNRVFQQMNSIVEELIKQNPDLYIAYQMRAFIYLPLLPSPNAPLDEFDQALLACEAFRLKDPVVAEMRFGYFMHKKDIDGLVKNAKANIAVMPQFGVGHYYLALAYWKQNNKSWAVDELKQAIKIEPENERFRKTLSMIKNAEPGSSGPFTQNVFIRFDQTF